MKIAVLLPGYLDSPDYLHMKFFDTRLTRLGYTVVLPEENEKMVTSAQKPYVVRKAGINHDIRRSENECNTVMDEIVKFLQMNRN